MCFAEGSWWKLGTGKAAACTSPRFLPCGWKLWKYQALTLQSIKENRGREEKEPNNYLGLIKELPGEIVMANYEATIKSSSEMKTTSWGK